MRGRAKLFVALAIVAAAVFAAAAYATSLAAPPHHPVKFRGATPGSGKGLKIGYISLGEQVPFVVLVSNSIKKQAKIAGAQLVFCD
jgi:ribose transport system substrate-binding protein